jgi:deoxyadenosine/deoxycytidine kinase
MTKKRSIELYEKEAKALDEALDEAIVDAEYEVEQRLTDRGREIEINSVRDREDLRKKLRAVFPELKR